MNKESIDKNVQELGRQVQEYDNYRVVRGLVSLTPKEEVNLVLVWFTGLPALALIFIGLVSMFTNEWTLDESTKLLTVGLSGVGVLLGVIAIQKLRSLKKKIYRGWSTLFFLGTDWIYASPNRNYLIGAFIAFASAFTTGFFTYASVLGDFFPASPLAAISAVFFIILSGLALRHIRMKG